MRFFSAAIGSGCWRGHDRRVFGGEKDLLLFFSLWDGMFETEFFDPLRFNGDMICSLAVYILPLAHSNN